MDERQIVPGQRWASEAEPELGLGVVMQLESGRVELYFPAAAEQRLYALASAPLRRVRFGIGDLIEIHDGKKLRVEAIEERDGRLRYETADGPIEEARLADTIRFSRPEDRLFAGVIDGLDAYRLRVEALRERAALRASSTRGFKGARIDLLPHQLATAGEVANRPLPRVLLADEVGLGKTIEACLITHRLLLTGRVSRVLVVVPEPLIHQWFVELLRRFNLMFSLYDEERYTSLRADGQNPFLDAQWVLLSQEFLTSSSSVEQAVVDAGWDLLVVDEAHHLEWTPEAPSVAYAAVERLAADVPGVLLLTATPEQLGQAGHFARLRLLDPDRYADLEKFLVESGGYRAVAELVEALESSGLASIGRTQFEDMAGGLDAAKRLLVDWPKEEAYSVESVVNRLIDAFGPGRVLFRTTRAELHGFPGRRAIFHPLPEEEAGFEARVRWLAEFLGSVRNEKILLITHSRAAVESIARSLGERLNVAMALFHEGLSLMQRDRNAAYFAEADGARILLCSEIGSEGRNFQFARHLVLFDLPTEPELLEQRIGRLDRIGQTAMISIHLPFFKGTREEAWMRWYHEGLNAFERCLPAGHDLAEQFAGWLDALAEPIDEAELRKIIDEARCQCEAFRERLADGRDRLLGLHPDARGRAEALIGEIRKEERSPAFQEFALRLFDACGLAVDVFPDDRLRLSPSPLMAESFPGLPESGLLMTFGREDALAREDLGFLTSDHPFVEAALDLCLGTENGNTAFALWAEAGFEGIVIEAWFVIESIAPKRLHLDRFLAPAPIRVILNHEGEAPDSLWSEDALQAGDAGPLLERGAVKRKLLPRMLEQAHKIAEDLLPGHIAMAQAKMTDTLDNEIERLRLLRRLNNHVRDDEIQRLETERAELKAAIAGAQVSLDSIRLVWCRE